MTTAAGGPGRPARARRRARTLPVWRKVLVAVAAALAVLVVGTLVAGAVVVRRPYPLLEGSLEVPGLSGTVDVVRDRRGVPQVYADTATDLFLAQGYVHAQDRFFEMDWRRHVTAGRLSELTGANETALRADTVVRTLGWRRVAQAEYAALDATTKAYLDAYSQGVNAYLKGRSAADLSLDYTLLGLANDLPEVEPWTGVDSLSWFKAMAWDLRGNYDDELVRARTYAATKDLNRVEQLFPPYPYDRHATIVAGAGSLGAQVPTALTSAPAGVPAGRPADPGTAAALADPGAAEALEDALGAVLAVPRTLGGTEGVGSNSWVIGSTLSSTGKPLLANDPHLAPSIPGIWYQMGLHCRTVGPQCPFDVAGFTFSGVPGVVIGHTQRIAWGLTNLGPDVTDFYLEKVTGQTYERDGAAQPLQVRTETIRVAGGDPVTITVRSTVHGPLLSDAVAPLAQAGPRSPVGRSGPVTSRGYAVSLAWTALTPGTDLQAIFGVNAATDFASFRKAVLLLDVPAQNFVYADVDGHIGYQAPGRIPLRNGATSYTRPTEAGDPTVGSPTDPNALPVPVVTPVPTDGTWPLPGWQSRYDWDGYAPTAALPWVEDPADGFVVAANQAVTGPNGPVAFGGRPDNGDRSQRIRDLLSAAVLERRTLDVADLAAIQADTRSPIAADLLPLVKAAQVDDFTADGVRLLDGWDAGQPASSAAAAYFNAFWARLLDLTFADEMPEGTRPDGGSRWTEVVRTLLDRPRDPWWDDRRTTEVVETRDEIVRRALVEARLRLTQIVSKDPAGWSWGLLHRLDLRRTPLGTVGSLSALDGLLNRTGLELPGGPASVNALGWDAASGSFAVDWGPSMRMVVNLADLDGSTWVNQTGASGHPGHENYADQLDAWAQGRTFAWPFTARAVEEAAVHRLTLEPSNRQG